MHALAINVRTRRRCLRRSASPRQRRRENGYHQQQQQQGSDLARRRALRRRSPASHPPAQCRRSVAGVRLPAVTRRTRTREHAGRWLRRRRRRRGGCSRPAWRGSRSWRAGRRGRRGRWGAASARRRCRSRGRRGRRRAARAPRPWPRTPPGTRCTCVHRERESTSALVSQSGGEGDSAIPLAECRVVRICYVIADRHVSCMIHVCCQPQSSGVGNQYGLIEV
uniref:Uncharacterized protein n=1 Tax=Zea mays TaxID=4577 RepID=A0A804PJ82_MAIZE